MKTRVKWRRESVKQYLGWGVGGFGFFWFGFVVGLFQGEAKNQREKGRPLW